LTQHKSQSQIPLNQSTNIRSGLIHH